MQCCEFEHAAGATKDEQVQLLDLLTNAGYADVQLHLLIFGSTCGMFKLTANI